MLRELKQKDIGGQAGKKALLLTPVEVEEYCREISARLPSEEELEDSGLLARPDLWWLTDERDEYGYYRLLGRGATYYSAKTGQELAYPFERKETQEIWIPEGSWLSCLAVALYYPEQEIVNNWRAALEEELYNGY